MSQEFSEVDPSSLPISGPLIPGKSGKGAQGEPWQREVVSYHPHSPTPPHTESPKGGLYSAAGEDPGGPLLPGGGGGGEQVSL